MLFNIKQVKTYIYGGCYIVSQNWKYFELSIESTTMLIQQDKTN